MFELNLEAVCGVGTGEVEKRHTSGKVDGVSQRREGSQREWGSDRSFLCGRLTLLIRLGLSQC